LAEVADGVTVELFTDREEGVVFEEIVVDEER
jgi:hypothetical protein